MPTYPNPAGGTMQAANDADARAKGWTPAMGSLGVNTYPDSGNNSKPSNPQPTGPGDAGGLGAAIDALLNARAAGNKQDFDEKVREFNATYGLDRDKFNQDVSQFNQNYILAQSGLTGTYNGQQTQAAMKQAAEIAQANAGLTGTFQGAPTLAAQNQAFKQQMDVINAAQAAQANPFRQQQLYGQANRIFAGQSVPGFQAPGTVAGVGTAGGNTQGGLGYLSQMISDIRDPTPNQTSADSFLAQTPTPNKIDSQSFLRSNPSTQNLILNAMQERYGIDPKDAIQQINNTLPAFNAPNTVGTVRRG